MPDVMNQNQQGGPINAPTMQSRAVPPTDLRNIVQQASQAAAESDLGRWLMSGARLLTIARRSLLEAERGYTAGRGKIIADAQAKLADLQQTTREELRRFDIEHEAKLDQLKRDVARLENMRDAGEWPA